MATANTGFKGWEVLEEYSISDETPTGNVMPNVYKISPQAIVPDTATLTYNQLTDVAPGAGADGDIWYNEPADELFKKIVGVWTILTDRVINTNYVGPVVSTDCPV